MKKLILALMLATTACSANQVMHSIPVVGKVCTVATGTLIDDKVRYAADALYNVPAHAYVTALNNGKITPALKAKLKPMLQQLRKYQKAVIAAYGTVNCDYNSMKELHAQILELIPRN